jgi:dihydroorotate dehydrogenase
MISSLLYKTLLRPWLFRMDSEEAHYFVHSLAKSYKLLWSSSAWACQYSKDDLSCEFAGVKVKNPVGLAAGFDKNGDLVDILGLVGFGFAEIGSVSARSCKGNPKPRLFRLIEDEALINRLGLNSDGADRIAEKLKSKEFSLPVGLNIVKTNDPSIVGDAAVEDMLYTFNKLKDLPISYVTVNASCPNTEEGIMSEAKALDTLFAQMQEGNSRRLPVFVKLSPDSSRQLVEDIVATASKRQLAGFVCGNTSTSRNALATGAAEIERIGNGGLSGPPLKNLSLQLCKLVYEIKTPEQVIIGCGGISSGKDAYEFICSGASAVQLYTGLVYEGPTLPKKINQELSQLLRANGLSLADAVGTFTRGTRRETSTASR